MMFRVSRYHDISVGHRVVGHKGKCRFLHGHNYRIHFHCESNKLDDTGMVVDFSLINQRLCLWLELNWDHKFIAWDNDNIMVQIVNAISKNKLEIPEADENDLLRSIVFVPFNPTAENIAEWLVTVLGPARLQETGITLIEVRVDETSKCSASYRL